MFVGGADGNQIVRLYHRFLNACVVEVGPIGGILVANHYLTSIVQPNPGVLAGDLVISEHHLAIGMIATDGQTFRRDAEGAPGEGAGGGDESKGGGGCGRSRGCLIGRFLLVRRGRRVLRAANRDSPKAKGDRREVLHVEFHKTLLF